VTDRLIFVLGTGRCGTTLVHELLARHEDVGWVSNIDDRVPVPLSGRGNGRLFRSLPPSFAAKGRPRFAPSEGLRSVGREVSPLVARPYRDLVAADAMPWLAERLRAYHGRRARAQRTPAFLYKFVGWPRAGLLDAVFPEARFVHVYRDGRAVANSLLQTSWWPGNRGPVGWPYGPVTSSRPHSELSFPELAGLTWAALMDAYEAAASTIPSDRWLEVRYEDLVAAPEEGARRVLGFCGLDWTPSYQRQFARMRFSTGRIDAFRTDLDPASVALLEDVLRSRLCRLGYLSD
jgi:hypothetical protein